MDNNIPYIDVQLDQSWQLQGRIIPPSCSSGDGCILHLQTRLNSWAKDHFHTGRVPINAEAGVEFVMSLLIPVEAELLRDSLEAQEREQELDYLAMAKMAHPEGSIAFATINGLTIVIHNPGLSALFGSSDKCRSCKAQEASTMMLLPNYAPLPEVQFDSLMQITGTEKSH